MILAEDFGYGYGGFGGGGFGNGDSGSGGNGSGEGGWDWNGSGGNGGGSGGEVIVGTRKMSATIEIRQTEPIAGPLFASPITTQESLW